MSDQDNSQDAYVKVSSWTDAELKGKVPGPKLECHLYKTPNDFYIQFELDTGEEGYPNLAIISLGRLLNGYVKAFKGDRLELAMFLAKHQLKILSAEIYE